MPSRWVGSGDHRHDYKVDIQVLARTRDLCHDGALRAGQSVLSWLERAVREQHWRDIRQRHHQICEQRRLMAKEKAPADPQI